MPADTLDYSSHESSHGHMVEIDRRDNVLQLIISHPNFGETCGEFTLAEPEEIAAPISRVCRNIRKQK